MNETWRAVVGFEGLYEVSDRGRVRSLDRRIKGGFGGTRIYPGRIMRPASTPTGHLRVLLSGFGNRASIGVHRLVCRECGRVRGREYMRNKRSAAGGA